MTPRDRARLDDKVVGVLTGDWQSVAHVAAKARVFDGDARNSLARLHRVGDADRHTQKTTGRRNGGIRYLYRRAAGNPSGD